MLAITTSRIDRWAVGLSGLCLVHCLGTAILFAAIATTGGLLGSPIIHEVGLTFAMVLGTIALGRGIVEHGYSMPAMVGAFGLGVMAGALTLPEGGLEPVYTVLGVSILALGHRLNHIAAE